MSDRQFQYAECYVAFLDILGFRGLAERSVGDPDVLRRIILVLNEAAGLAPPEIWKRIPGGGEDKHWRMQVRPFSDSIVFFVPAESRLIGSVLVSICFLYDRLLEMDCCLRGAVCIGSMYWHDAWNAEKVKDPRVVPGDSVNEEASYKKFGRWDLPITLGPGLNEAYDLEEHVAKYPRILISDALYARIHELEQQGLVRFCALASPDPQNASLPITDFIRTDADGLRHLDILHPKRSRRYVVRETISRTADGKARRINEFNEQTREEWLKSVRDFIARHLDPSKEPSVRGKVREKYEWFATYFNECLAEEKPPLSGVEPIRL